MRRRDGAGAPCADRAAELAAAIAASDGELVERLAAMCSRPGCPACTATWTELARARLRGGDGALARLARPAATGMASVTHLDRMVRP